MAPIYHLCVGNYVFENIGFTDSELPELYVYLIHGNRGDFYKVNGVQSRIGKLAINRKNKKYFVVSQSDLLDLEAIAEPVKFLVKNYFETK